MSAPGNVITSYSIHYTKLYDAASPQVSYYSLYASMQRPVTATADTLAVSVGPVTVPDILKRPQIATGGTDGLYRLAEFHRWSGELDRDFARA